MFAVLANLCDEVLKLVARGCPINAANSIGHTALHIAVQHGHVICVGILLNHGAMINDRDINGLSSLHHAASRGAPILAKALATDATLDVYLRCRKTFRLSLGSGPVQGDTIPFLLTADITALHLAAAHGHTGFIDSMVLVYGADILLPRLSNVEMTIGPDAVINKATDAVIFDYCKIHLPFHKWSALTLSMALGETETCAYLMGKLKYQYRPEVSQVFNTAFWPMRIALIQTIDIPRATRQCYDEWPSSIAGFHAGYFGKMDIILSYIDRPGEYPLSSMNAIMWAAWGAASNCTIILALLHAMFVLKDQEDEHGTTPLVLAATQESGEAFEFLVDNGFTNLGRGAKWTWPETSAGYCRQVNFNEVIAMIKDDKSEKRATALCWL